MSHALASRYGIPPFLRTSQGLMMTCVCFIDLSFRLFIGTQQLCCKRLSQFRPAIATQVMIVITQLLLHQMFYLTNANLCIGRGHLLFDAPPAALEKHWIICSFIFRHMTGSELESFQDLLIELGMKLHMHLVEISIFLNKQCYRQTYQNYEQPPQTFQNSDIQSHFSVSKIDGIFPKEFLFEEYQNNFE